MIELVTGGSGSGKSGHAEQLVMNLGNRRRIYVATMKPWDRECEERIERHREMRKEKSFETVECWCNLGSLVLSQEEAASRVILLECMSNLVSNELFGIGTEHDITADSADESWLRQQKERVETTVWDGIMNLTRQAKHLIIVTNEVFSDGVEEVSPYSVLNGKYDRLTLLYLEILGELNQRLGAMADRVTEVVAGIPVSIKGRK